jgi:hypothetical protein
MSVSPPYMEKYILFILTRPAHVPAPPYSLQNKEMEVHRG